jgi:ketosteroid isomerase-like protein
MMTRSLMLASLLLAAPATAQTKAEAELAALDARQKEMVARADIAGLAALAAPTMTINAPTGRVLTRDQFLAMMRNGQIGAEAFERTVERVTVSDDTGIVMGNEVFTPTPDSELGRTYGAVPLKRRYTNVYVRDHGRWLWFARHANVTPGQAAKR